MRKQITLFDDQYAFYKQFKSKKLLISFVEYMFEDIEPTWLNPMEQTLWNALVERMDNWKTKADAWSIWWSKSHWGGATIGNQNAKKTTSKTTSKTTNRQQAKQQANNKQDKDKEEDKENIILSPIGDNSEAEFWNQEINNLIWELKEQCNQLGIAYEKKDERNFAKHILTAKDYWDFAEKIWQGRVQFAKNIIIASCQLKYKWICAWPKAIYQHYAEIYNEFVKNKPKQKAIVLDDL